MKYYHCSPKRIPVGTIISGHNTAAGVHRPGCSGKVKGDVIFMAGSVQPHYTILQRAKEERWFIYEVEPLGKVVISDFWDEYVTHSARIVKFVRRVKKSDYGSDVRKRPYTNGNWSEWSDEQGKKCLY